MACSWSVPAPSGLGCTLAAIAPSYRFIAGALVIVGGAALTFTSTTNSLVQLSTEPAMRGRVMVLRVGVALGGTPIIAGRAGCSASARLQASLPRSLPVAPWVSRSHTVRPDLPSIQLSLRVSAIGNTQPFESGDQPGFGLLPSQLFSC